MEDQKIVRQVKVFLSGGRMAEVIVTWDCLRKQRRIGNQSLFPLEKGDKKQINWFLRMYEKNQNLPHYA